MAAARASAFPINIERLLNCHFNGNVAALARFLAVNRYSVLAWKAGVHRPTLLSLADLSHKVSAPMADLLGTHLEAADFTLQTDGGSQPGRRRFLSPPKTDLAKMRQVMEEAAKGDVSPYPSLSKLAIQLGCNQSTLQRRFPELTEEIKQRFQKHAAIRKEVRAKLFRSIVNSTIMEIHKAGIYPSQSRVRESLPKFVDMREPVAHEEWKHALTTLNYTIS
jgi:DNA-binding transcriptional regulator YhcF (GntR family)